MASCFPASFWASSGETLITLPGELMAQIREHPLRAAVLAGSHPGRCRLFRNISEIEKLSELGVLFLLFEMVSLLELMPETLCREVRIHRRVTNTTTFASQGLELSLDRLKV